MPAPGVFPLLGKPPSQFVLFHTNKNFGIWGFNDRGGTEGGRNQFWKLYILGRKISLINPGKKVEKYIKRGKIIMASKTTKKSRLQGQNFRWVVPQLPAEIWDRKEQFKADLLDRLRLSKTAKKGIKYYSIAIESHANGEPHLDMLIILQKRTDLFLDQLDFLANKHGNLTRYRNLNQVILEYGSKQDQPLTNCPDIRQLLDQQSIKKDPYVFLQEHMLKDPYGFNLAQFCAKFNYFQNLPGFNSIESRLKKHQEAICNLHLKSKPGIRVIDNDLIQSTLTTSQLELYHSWSGYQQIVNFLNQIPTYGTKRSTHTQNLFIHGRPRTGKTSLVEAIQKSTSVYPVGTINWFPKFQNHIYKLMFWDQCRLSMMTWEQMLILLDGRPYDLPYKGGSTLKYDNQLWIMTSNKSVRQHLKEKYSFLRQDFDNPLEQNVIETSFRKRVKEITIPDGYDLFILLKLIQ